MVWGLLATRPRFAYAAYVAEGSCQPWAATKTLQTPARQAAGQAALAEGHGGHRGGAGGGAGGGAARPGDGAESDDEDPARAVGVGGKDGGHEVEGAGAGPRQGKRDLSGACCLHVPPVPFCQAPASRCLRRRTVTAPCARDQCGMTYLHQHARYTRVDNPHRRQRSSSAAGPGGPRGHAQHDLLRHTRNQIHCGTRQNEAAYFE
jgi:hypothetical protein